MTPINFLQTLLKVNRTGAVFIMTGLAVLAAGAVAVSWLGDGENAMTLAFYILGFAVVVAILSYVVTNPLMKTVIGWMIILGLGLTMGLALDSVLQLTGRTPYPVCLRKMLEEPPKTCMARFATGETVVAQSPPVDEPLIISENESAVAQSTKQSVQGNSTNSAIPQSNSVKPKKRTTNTASNNVQAPAPQQAPIVKPVEEPIIVAEPVLADDLNAPKIFLQFHSGVTREHSRDVALKLEELGWNVEGADQGGENTSTGPDGTAIRFYSAGYAETARALASDLSYLRDDTPVRLQDFSKAGLIAPENLIEVWLGKPQ